MRPHDLPAAFRTLFELPGGVEAKWWSVWLGYDRRLTARQVRRLRRVYGELGAHADRRGITWGQWPGKWPGPDDAVLLYAAVLAVGRPVRVCAVPHGRDCATCPWSGPGAWCVVGRGCSRPHRPGDWWRFDPWAV